MLQEFTVKNFRSIRDQLTLSMEAGNMQEHSESIFIRQKDKLLPVSIIYGANSSGKSNVLKSLSAMVWLVTNSIKLGPKETLLYDPFMLDDNSRNVPTFFEIVFFLGENRFRYGFEYNKSQIVSEWLYEKRSREREYELFIRENLDFNISEKRFPEGQGKPEHTTKNRLFLSLVSQLKGEVSNQVMSWFESQCNSISGIDQSDYNVVTLAILHEKNEGFEKIKSLFRDSKLGFDDIVTKEEDSENVINSMKSKGIPEELLVDLKGKTLLEGYTTHNIYDDLGDKIRTEDFKIEKMESEGTRKMITLAGPIIDTLNQGKVLIVDELDSQLHAKLTRKLIRLFTSKKTNPNGAQLLFTTHDTSLLDSTIIRRDEIWFTNKDNFDNTEFYSLDDFIDSEGRKIRNDVNLQKGYLDGRFGGVPYILEIDI